VIDRTPAPPSAGRRSVAGESTFDGCIVFTMWPRDDVAGVLPPELTLADVVPASAALAGPGDGAAAGRQARRHPVAFVFGDQRDGRVVFARRALPLGIGYGELGLVIPFVRHREAARVHAFVARMYSSYFPVVWDGNVRYGFAKDLALMSWQGAMFVMTSADGALLLHAGIAPASSWSAAPANALAGFVTLREVFALPMLGRRADGVIVCSSFDWAFDAAAVRAVDAWISIDASLGPGLAPCDLEGTPGGAFEVRGMRWRLSWPGACRCR
jgi:hypothetical protein